MLRWRIGKPSAVAAGRVFDWGTEAVDYVKPADVPNAMVETGSRKLVLPTAEPPITEHRGRMTDKPRVELRQTSVPCRQSSAIAETMQ
jgi:hypothetical protein